MEKNIFASNLMKKKMGKKFSWKCIQQPNWIDWNSTQRNCKSYFPKIIIVIYEERLTSLWGKSTVKKILRKNQEKKFNRKGRDMNDEKWMKENENIRDIV